MAIWWTGRTWREQLSTSDKRRLRADARQNYDRLVEAAARAFARHGSQATLKAIAEEAGVGIGTLFRHFPNRESLVEAVYRNETERLCSTASELLRQMPPVDAMRAWTQQFLEYMATKDGMADVLHRVLTDSEDLRPDTRERLRRAFDILLDAGQRAGQLRSDLAGNDVWRALGGFALIVGGQPDAKDLGERLFDLLLLGIAAPQKK